MGWAVWVAFGLSLAGLFVWGVVFVQARRLWRQLSPQLAPLLGMFAAPRGDDDANE